MATWREHQGHVLVKQYSDPDGRSYTLDRPIFQQLLRDARAGLFDIVAVWKWDRFSRDQEQQGYAIYQLMQYDVQVVSVTQSTEQRNLYAFASETELVNLRERTYNGRRARVSKGKLPPLPIPVYGYRFVEHPDEAEPKRRYPKDRYEPDRETSWVVAYLFDLVLAGETLRGIARRFEQEGIPTPTQVLVRRGQIGNREVSSAWRTSTLHRILTNRAYIGQLEGWWRETVTAHRGHPVTGETIEYKRLVERAADDPDRVVYPPEICPPLVDAAKFAAVQDLLARHKAEAPRRLHDPHAVLLRSGFLRCGYCSKAMVAQWSKADDRYRYSCTTRGCTRPTKFSYRAPQMDQMVWNWVLHAFENTEVIGKTYAQWKAEQDEDSSIDVDRLAAIANALRTAQRRKTNFTNMAADTSDDDARREWQSQAEEEARRARKQAKDYETLQRALAHRGQGQEAIESIIALGQRTLDHLRMAEYDDKRRVLHAFQVEVTAWVRDHEPPYEVGWVFDRLHSE